MHRTTILLPESIKEKIEKVARSEETSIGELVRRALENYLLGKKDPWFQDSFLTSQTFFDANTEPVTSASMDAYLYDHIDVHGRVSSKKKNKI